MTNLERVMSTETEEHQRQIAGWVSLMSPACQDLCQRCPPKMMIHVGDLVFYVVGYSETKDHEHAHLLVSPIDPDEDFEASTANPISVCPEKMVIYKHGELN